MMFPQHNIMSTGNDYRYLWSVPVRYLQYCTCTGTGTYATPKMRDSSVAISQIGEAPSAATGK